MRQVLLLTVGLLPLAGCATPAERIPLQPLPEKGQTLDYVALVQRARLYALAANEAFYLNQWDELAQAAQRLEQAGQLLPTATGVPATRQDKLATHAGDLSEQAKQLRSAAQGKDVKRTNDLLQRLHLLVRDLRPDE